MCHVNMPVEERSVYYACTFDALKSYFDRKVLMANKNGRVLFAVAKTGQMDVVLEVAFCEVESLILLGFLQGTMVCYGCSNGCRDAVPFVIAEPGQVLSDQSRVCFERMELSFEQIRAIHVKDDVSKAIVKAFMSSRPLTQKIEIIVDGR